MRYADYFTGGGLATWGARAAGFDVKFGVECDPGNLKQSMRIADHTEMVFGSHMIRKPVQDVDPATLPPVDWFHASTVCKNYSTAKSSSKGDESIDLITAQATADYIDYHRPSWVSIENVIQYRDSDALGLILAAFQRGGYCVRQVVVNMADYGVPQTRRRLIVLARRGADPGFPAPTHSKNPVPGLFGTLQPWVGWYAAIEDILHTLPDSEFAAWQVAKLPDCLSESFLSHTQSNSRTAGRYGFEPSTTLAVGKNPDRALLVHHTDQRTMPVMAGNDPSFTITQFGKLSYPRAFLVNGSNASRELSIRTDHQPSITVNGPKHPIYGFIGRVVKMTARALARYQSLPDEYPLPERTSDAVTIIGNGVPPLFMRLLGEHIKSFS